MEPGARTKIAWQNYMQGQLWMYIVLSIRLQLSGSQVYGINCRQPFRNDPTRLVGAPEVFDFWVHWFDVCLRSGEQRKLSGQCERSGVETHRVIQVVGSCRTVWLQPAP